MWPVNYGQVERVVKRFRRGDNSGNIDVDELKRCFNAEMRKTNKKRFLIGSVLFILFSNLVSHFLICLIDEAMVADQEHRTMPLDILTAISPPHHPWIAAFVVAVNVIAVGAFTLNKIYNWSEDVRS